MTADVLPRTVAFKQAVRKLIDNHRDEFEALYATERGPDSSVSRGPCFACDHQETEHADGLGCQRDRCGCPVYEAP